MAWPSSHSRSSRGGSTLNPQLNLQPQWATTPKTSTRQGFGDALVQLGQVEPKLMVLTANLKQSTKTDHFADLYPDLFFDLGVAEQNLLGVAAGMAASGLIPVCTSYAVFSPGRNWEQLRNSVCYSNLNVKLVSTHTGLSVGPDGATHQALEDVALTRVLPHLTVISPADYHQAYRATIAAVRHPGPVYLRLARENSFSITTKDTPFELGKAQILRFGSAATLVSTGFLLGESLQAAEEIDAEVINIHTIKPLDINTIIQSLKKTGKLMVVEEHQLAGGLGSAVLEPLANAGVLPPKIKLLGVDDQFGQSGTPADLLEAYGLTWHHIVEKYRQLQYTRD